MNEKRIPATPLKSLADSLLSDWHSMREFFEYRAQNYYANQGAKPPLYYYESDAISDKRGARLLGEQAAEIARLTARVEELERTEAELLGAFDALERAWRGRPVRNLDEHFVAVARIVKSRSNKEGGKS